MLGKNYCEKEMIIFHCIFVIQTRSDIDMNDKMAFSIALMGFVLSLDLSMNDCNIVGGP